MTYRICSGCKDKIPYMAPHFVVTIQVGPRRNREAIYCTTQCFQRRPL